MAQVAAAAAVCKLQARKKGVTCGLEPCGLLPLSGTERTGARAPSQVQATSHQEIWFSGKEGNDSIQASQHVSTTSQPEGIPLPLLTLLTCCS